jgi:hypothetical protein
MKHCPTAEYYRPQRWKPLSCHTLSLVSRWPESCASGSGKVKHLNPQGKSVSWAHRDGGPIPAVSVILRRAMASGLAGEREANWRHRSPRCQVSRGRALLEQLAVASRARCRFRGWRHGTLDKCFCRHGTKSCDNSGYPKLNPASAGQCSAPRQWPQRMQPFAWR